MFHSLKLRPFIVAVAAYQAAVFTKVFSGQVVDTQAHNLRGAADTAFWIVEPQATEMTASAPFTGDFAFIIVHGSPLK